MQHPRTGLALGPAYALILLYAALMYHVVGDYRIKADFFWSYVPAARQILLTIEIENFHGPAYPVILGLISFVIGNFFKAGVVLPLRAPPLRCFAPMPFSGSSLHLNRRSWVHCSSPSEIINRDSLVKGNADK